MELNRLANQFKLQRRDEPQASSVSKEEVVLFVEKAAEYLKSASDRKKAYEEMSDPHGRFVKGDLYIFVNTKGKGWVDYKWMNPGTGRILEKTTYCQRVGDVYIGCGIYK